ncbi:MAG: phenylalanine--tRNA ligase subunit beta [Patescibacteria group bacterium]
MNILIPHKWLLEHLETDASPQDIQRLVSLSGPSIERIYERDGDSVYDIEVTTNRVDTMSVRGIARECAVILQHAGVAAKLKPLHLPGIEAGSNLFPEPKIVNNPQFCKRVLYVILKDVKRTATPDWMAQRLSQVDIGVHDAVIDITNYITHELGHPCHAFDYDKIMKLGGEIIVKEATPGKIFTTLDGMEYKTIGGEIVFENQKGEIIDFPAIKGTANTSIDDRTQNVLFWIESLDPKKVRFGSMTHAIRTVAAQLNEKDVDPELAMDVLKKGVELYQELCDAQVASEVYDEYPQPRQFEPISVKKDTIDTYLGVELENKIVEHILEELGCKVEKANDTTFLVTPPSFRPDLKIPVDIVEEVARIYGYHNLPSVVMHTPIPLSRQEGVNFQLEEKIKHFLSDIGWQELYTYSLVSEKLAVESGWALDEHLKLQNPLTDDRVYLRNSLVPSLNEVIDSNPNESSLSVFEIANVYWKTTTGLPDEVLMLSMVSNREFRKVKGDLEALLDRLHISNLSQELKNPQIPTIAQSSILKTTHSGEVVQLGTIAVLKNGRTVIQLELTNLIRVTKKHPTYKPIPQTAQIIEDLTFTMLEKTQLGPVIESVKKVSPLISFVELKDVFKQNVTLTITYLNPTQNISSVDVEPVRRKIVEKLKEDYKAILVGKLY